jgi:hypothetical protein
MAVLSANARDFVDRPGPGWENQPYGLFTVAKPLRLSDHASVEGQEFLTPYCSLPVGYAVNCTPGSKASALTGAYVNVPGDPFVVLAGMECGAMTAENSGQSPDDYTRNFVISKLKAGEQRAVENIFSRGLVGQAPGLSTAVAPVTVPTPTNDNMINAIQALEAAYAALFGLPGVLHVPIKAMAQLATGHLTEAGSDGVIRTPMGTPISLGNYAGYGPADVAPADAAHRWIWMTGPVSVWRQDDADMFVSPWAESIDKTTNQIHRFAERTYIVEYECTPLALLANVEACC